MLIFLGEIPCRRIYATLLIQKLFLLNIVSSKVSPITIVELEESLCPDLLSS